jgi:hypothetical protein
LGDSGNEIYGAHNFKDNVKTRNMFWEKDIEGKKTPFYIDLMVC